MKSRLVLLMFMLSLFWMMPSAAAQTDYSHIHAVMLNQDPDPAQPGDYVELRFKISKTGNNLIKDLKFRLDPSYPLYFDASDRPVKEIGEWIGYSGDDEYYTLYYKLRVDDDALEESYDVNLLYSQEGRAFIPLKDFEVRVDEAKEASFILGNIVTDPRKLTADMEDVELNIDLSNMGDEEAENVRAELVLPQGFTPSYSFAERHVLGTIPEGQSSRATFYMDIDKNMAGSHDAYINVSYKEDDKYKHARLPFSIGLLDKPSFKVEDVRTSPELIKPGMTFTLSMKVRNTGAKEAESVSIRAFKDASQPFEFEEKASYVGNLEPGQRGDAVIKISVDNDAPKREYLFDIEVRSIYQDEVNIDEETVSIKVDGDETRSKKEITVNPALGILITVIIVLVGFAAYNAGKKHKS